MRPRLRLLTAFLGAVVCALPLAGAAGCSGAQVREQSEVVRRELDKARSSGAKRCAPRELAIAEANHAFADAELDKGNADRAHEHISIAAAAVEKALLDSKDCAPRNVIIKHDKPVVVTVQKTDTDGDGIPDTEDKCPNEPEDFDGFEDEDGCPDLDNDNDGIPDSVDQCPNDPEDRDGFQDEDGCPDPDNDGDGVLDAVDDCPVDPGPVENRGCPVTDADGDGIEDDQDRCPNDPEDFDGFEDEDGCPDYDNDRDGVPDTEDACPNEPGIPELRGCPPGDRDRDGVPDHIDRCPDEAGVIEEQGCPRKYTLVVLKQEKIEILEQVHFETGKHRILPDSFGLLDQVAMVLKDNPSIRVRIEGHTDSQGSDNANMTLSQNRANSVRDYLVHAGVSSERLLAVGFGETTPIATNATAQGRALNRRVEFNITSR